MMKPMNMIACLFRKLIFIRVQLEGSEILRKELAVVRFHKGKAFVKEWKRCEADSFSKYKNNLALLLVTSDQVVTKVYDREDQTIRRIIKNPELIWSTDTTEGQEPTLSFLRREGLNSLLGTIEKNKMLLIDTWIQGADDESVINTKLEHSYETLFRSTGLNKAVDLKNRLANLLFHKMLLPVLSFFLLLLLGNYFVYSHYTEQYQIKQSKIHQDKRANKAKSSNNQKENQLTAIYNQIPHKSFALLADRMASYIPNNLILTSMVISPLVKNGNSKSKNEIQIDYQLIRLKGSVETPGSVTLLTQLLEADALFSKVKVTSLYRKKDTDNFDFELEITL